MHVFMIPESSLTLTDKTLPYSRHVDLTSELLHLFRHLKPLQNWILLMLLTFLIVVMISAAPVVCLFVSYSFLFLFLFFFLTVRLNYSQITKITQINSIIN